jgi:hypothetical protein
MAGVHTGEQFEESKGVIVKPLIEGQTMQCLYYDQWKRDKTLHRIQKIVLNTMSLLPV